MQTRISFALGSLAAVLVPLAGALTPARATTPTPTIACTGDCDDDGMVSAADIQLGVHLLFDLFLYDQCPAYPLPLPLRVAGLLQAVRNRADDCGGALPSATPTSTPTPTPSPTTALATPTATAGEIPPAIAGRTTIVVNAMGVIPNAVTAIVAGLEFGGSSSLGANAGLPGANAGGGAGACPLGGTATRTGDLPLVSITLDQCAVATADGSATFTGTASINFTSFNVNVTSIFRDQMGAETRRSSAMITGTVSPTFGGDCSFTAANLTVNSGSLGVETPDELQVGVTFMNTQVRIDQLVFNPDCVPLEYRLTFNGNAALLTPDGEPSTVSFSAFVMDVDDRADPTRFELSGAMSSSCFGGAVGVATITPLAVPSGQLCPSEGQLEITREAGGPARIHYGADGSVTIEQDGEEEDYPNCLDPRLLMCLA